MVEKIYRKGFTIIELLVTFSIIALLASSVLAAVGSARTRASDAKVKTQLEQVRNAAALYYSSNQTYGTTPGALLCDEILSMTSEISDTVFNDPTVARLVTSSNYPYPNQDHLFCAADGTDYAVSAALSNYATGNGFWCVDSQGYSGLRDGSIEYATCN